MNTKQNLSRVSRQNYKAYIELKGSHNSLKSRSEINNAANRQLFIQNTKVVLDNLNSTVIRDDYIYSKVENCLQELEGTIHIESDTDVEQSDEQIPVKTRNANANHETEIEVISISSSTSHLSIVDQLYDNNEKPTKEEKHFSGFTNDIVGNHIARKSEPIVPKSDHNRDHKKKVRSSLNAKNTKIKPEKIQYDKISDIKDIKSNECLALSRQRRKRTAVTYNGTHLERWLFCDTTYNTRRTSNSARKKSGRPTIPKQKPITNTVSVGCQTDNQEVNLDVAIWKTPTKNKSNVHQEEKKDFVAATIVHIENKPDSNEKSEVEINIPRTLRNTMNESCFKISIDLSRIDLPHKVLKSLDAAKKNEPKTKRKLKAITDETEVKKPKRSNRTRKTKGKDTEKSAIAQYVELFSNDCEPSTDNAVTSCFSPDGSNNLISTTSNNNMDGNIHMDEISETSQTYLTHNEEGQWILTTQPEPVPQNNNANNAGNYNSSQEPYDCIQLDDDIMIPLDIEDNALQLVNYIENEHDEQTGNLTSPFDSNDNITQPELHQDKNGFNHGMKLPQETGNLNFDNAPAKILGDLRPAHSSSYSKRPLSNDAIDLSFRNTRHDIEFKPQEKFHKILDLSLKSPSNLSPKSLQTSIQTSFSCNTYTGEKGQSYKYSRKIQYLGNPPNKLNRRRITIEEYSVRQKKNGSDKIEVLNVEDIKPIKRKEGFKGNDMPSLNFDEELNYEENINGIEEDDGILQMLELGKGQTEISTKTDIKETIAENVNTTEKDTKDSPRENINSISSSETSSYFDYNAFSANGICTPTGKINEPEFNAFEYMEREYNDRDDDIISLHPDMQSLLGSPCYNNDDPPDIELNALNEFKNFVNHSMPSSTSHTKPLCSVKRNAPRTITFNVGQPEVNVDNPFKSKSTEVALPLESKPNETSIKNFKIPKIKEKCTEFINNQRKITNENFIPNEERQREEISHQVPQSIVQSSSLSANPFPFRNIGPENTNRNDILSLFGYPCIKYLDDICQKSPCNFNHQLIPPDEIYLKLRDVPYTKLCSSYYFIRRHHKAFIEYFRMYCKIYAKNQFPNMVIQMINDCENYHDSFHYFRDILNCLTETGINKVEALRIILTRYQNKSFEMITLLVDLILETDVLAFLQTLDEFSNIPQYQFKLDAVNHMAAVYNETKNTILSKIVLKIIVAVPKGQIEGNKSHEIVKFLNIVSKSRYTNSLLQIGGNDKLGSVTTIESQTENDTLINNNNQIQYMNLSSTRNF